MTQVSYLARRRFNAYLLREGIHLSEWITEQHRLVRFLRVAETTGTGDLALEVPEPGTFRVVVFCGDIPILWWITPPMMPGETATTSMPPETTWI